MYPGWHVLIYIALRTALIYGVVLLGMRLSGKREVGQMTPFDLTLLLLLSNAVQNAMTGPDTSVLGGIVAAATLLLLNFMVAEVAGGNRRFRKFVQGQPSLLVHDGKVIPAHMAREHVTMDALQQALREHGITTYHDVALAVLEVDGSISCMKYDDISPRLRPTWHAERFCRSTSSIPPTRIAAAQSQAWCRRAKAAPTYPRHRMCTPADFPAVVIHRQIFRTAGK
jgi:uncharacterized membrane protein YcaP (DUF421 family)